MTYTYIHTFTFTFGVAEVQLRRTRAWDRLMCPARKLCLAHPHRSSPRHGCPSRASRSQLRVKQDVNVTMIMTDVALRNQSRTSVIISIPHGSIIIEKEGSVVTAVRSVPVMNDGRSEGITSSDNVKPQNKSRKVQHPIRNQLKATLDGTNIILIEIESANLQDQDSGHKHTSMQRRLLMPVLYHSLHGATGCLACIATLSRLRRVNQ